jgi:two-component system copper resistance phosphate regulon response regulator CusR
MQVAMSEHSGVLARFLPIMNQEFDFAPRMQEETSSAAYRVLIMEASAPLAKLLATGLSAESLTVDVTNDVASAARLLETRAYNMMIMDMDPPDLDGVNLLETLRVERPDLRVLVLSGRSGVEGLVTALDNGADDYLMKPFSLIELMARVRALRRRSDAPVVERAPKASKLVLNRDQCRVQRDGRNIDLTPREFALLEYMMQNAGKTLSRAMLTQEVWNMSPEANTNIVDVYVKYLRDKLDGEHDEKLIRTVRGMGYLFQMQ